MTRSLPGIAVPGVWAASGARVPRRAAAAPRWMTKGRRDRLDVSEGLTGVLLRSGWPLRPDRRARRRVADAAGARAQPAVEVRAGQHAGRREEGSRLPLAEL